MQETYDRYLLIIDGDFQEMARYTLIWMAFSKHSLGIKEVAEASISDPELNLAFNPEKKFYDHWGE